MIGGAVFLILEMDSQFEGVLRLSEQPPLRALSEMREGLAGLDRLQAAPD